VVSSTEAACSLADCDSDCAVALTWLAAPVRALGRGAHFLDDRGELLAAAVGVVLDLVEGAVARRG
jgi:hypothetical protein